jgi:hypothetical protein
MFDPTNARGTPAILLVVFPLLVGCGGTRTTQSNPARSPVEIKMEQAVIDYVTNTKGWARDEFRIEKHGVDQDTGHVVIWVIHRDDGKTGMDGGGKSVELHVDAKQNVVVREFHFQ